MKSTKKQKSNKMIYAIRPRTGVESNVVSAMAHLRMFDKKIVKDDVSSILCIDERVDAEFLTEFTRAIYETQETTIVVLSADKKIKAIMSSGIEIGHDMPSYLKELQISFANDSKTVRNAVVKHLNINSEVYVIAQNNSR